MKPPKTRNGRCSECLFIGRIKHWEIWVCPQADDNTTNGPAYVVYNDTFLDREEYPELWIKIKEIVAPYITNGKLNDFYKARINPQK